jgi:hypothetical protein
MAQVTAPILDSTQRNPGYGAFAATARLGGLSPECRYISRSRRAAAPSRPGSPTPAVLPRDRLDARAREHGVLSDLFGTWIDQVHARKPQTTIVLDMDSYKYTIRLPAIWAIAAPQPKGRRAVTDEIFVKRLESGLRSATNGRNRQLSGESR